MDKLSHQSDHEKRMEQLREQGKVTMMDPIVAAQLHATVNERMAEYRKKKRRMEAFSIQAAKNFYINA